MAQSLANSPIFRYDNIKSGMEVRLWQEDAESEQTNGAERC